MYLSTCDRGEVNEGDHDPDDCGFSCCDLLKCTVGLAVPLEAANSQTQLPTCGRLCISVIIVIAITIIIIINNL